MIANLKIFFFQFSVTSPAASQLSCSVSGDWQSSLAPEGLFFLSRLFLLFFLLRSRCLVVWFHLQLLCDIVQEFKADLRRWSCSFLICMALFGCVGLFIGVVLKHLSFSNRLLMFTGFRLRFGSRPHDNYCYTMLFFKAV